MKRLLVVLLSVLSLVPAFSGLAEGATALADEQPAMDTLNSIVKYGDGALYAMDYKADYKLDPILATGVGSDAEYLGYAMQTVMNGRTIQATTTEIGCSSFTVKTPEGQHIMGRNLDLPMPALPMMVKTTPANGYASIAIADLEFVGLTAQTGIPDDLDTRYAAMCAPYLPMDGVNEKGLSMSVMYLDGDPTRQDTGKPKILTMMAVRMVLDKAATVDEAVAMLQRYDMQSSGSAGSYHFMITDRTGKTVVVEYPKNEMVVLEQNVATNFYLFDGFGHGQDRYEKIQERMESTQAIMRETEVMDVLKIASQPLTADSKVSHTQWSVVYNLDALTAHVAIQMNYDQVFDFALSK